MSRTCLGLLALPVLLPASPAVGQESLQPGDMVEVIVWRNEELSGEFLVDEEGRLVHPLYREFIVTDVPINRLDQRIGEYLTRLEANPQFTVQPLLRVSVGGEVRQPNLYSLPPATTVVQAIAAAGGAGPNGKWDDVTLIRGASTTTLDLTSPSTHIEGMRIMSGDQYIVGRRSTVFRDIIAPVGALLGGVAAIIAVSIR